MGEQVDARSNGDVAQLGEHLPCKQGVESSNLSVSTGSKINLSMIQHNQHKFCASKTYKGNVSHFRLYLEN